MQQDLIVQPSTVPALDAGLLMAAIPDGVIAFDLECRYTAWNPAMEALSGVPAAEVLGRVAWEVFPFLKETGEDAILLAALAGEERTSSDGAFTIPESGRTGYFQGRYVPLRDAAGAVVGGMGVIRDVTATRAAEELLRMKSRVLASMSEGVSVADEEGTILYTNPAEDLIFGYEPGELVGRHVSVQNAYAPEENARIVAEVIDTLKRDGVWMGEWSNRRKDGTPFTTFARITALESGGRRLWVCVQADVTENKRARAELRDKRERLELALEAGRLGAWEVDLATGVLTASASCRAAFGRAEGELFTLGVLTGSIHPDDRAGVRARRDAAIRDGGEYEDECRVVWPDGTLRWVSVRGRALYAADGTPERMVGVSLDVTERKRAEVEREELLAREREARREAEDANRAKAEFLAAMSHELRTPLNAIAGYAELMAMEIHGPVTDEQRNDLARIRRNQSHLLALIENILNYARLEAGHAEFRVEEVPLADLLDDLDAVVAPQVSAKGVLYRHHLPEAVLAVRGDREKIQQVLVNLLTNAIKFTAPGGTVVVRCERMDGVLALQVSDTGRGIPAERLADIFDPFVQVDRAQLLTGASQPGVGLGLAISRELARGMGGTLTVESIVGEGSTFTLTLPT
jgi:PAS domain S-box-containing protein